MNYQSPETQTLNQLLSSLVVLQNKNVSKFNPDEIKLFLTIQKIIEENSTNLTSEAIKMLPSLTPSLLIIAGNFVSQNKIYLRESNLIKVLERSKQLGVITQSSKIAELVNLLMDAIYLCEILSNPQLIGLGGVQIATYINIYDRVLNGAYNNFEIMNIMSALQSAAYKIEKETTDELVKQKLTVFHMDTATVAFRGDKFKNDSKKYIRVILELNGVDLPPDEA
jgi:hypothetical protein